jgi:hypothetical protein
VASVGKHSGDEFFGYGNSTHAIALQQLVEMIELSSGRSRMTDYNSTTLEASGLNPRDNAQEGAIDRVQAGGRDSNVKPTKVTWANWIL